jgi:hypothetical protein
LSFLKLYHLTFIWHLSFDIGHLLKLCIRKNSQFSFLLSHFRSFALPIFYDPSVSPPRNRVESTCKGENCKSPPLQGGVRGGIFLLPHFSAPDLPRYSHPPDFSLPSPACSGPRFFLIFQTGCSKIHINWLLGVSSYIIS